MIPVTEWMMGAGHEQVVFVADAPTGLRAVIAVHSTALGPALGGVRFWHYEREDDAVRDVLRLSEAMTWKAAAAGLDQGGGKVVVLVDDPDATREPAMLHALGRAIDELGGRYLAAEDVGATQRDMDLIAEVTPWVTGVDPADGGSGDPSPVTAFGVVAAMRAVLARLDGDDRLAGRRVAVQGTGHVGSRLVALLAGAGASVVVADTNEARAGEVAAAHGADVVGADAILEQPCDVLSPCALGGVIDDVTVERLRCRAVCGAANNQLAREGIDDRLHERGILYAPDFVANAGGIINIAEEFVGYDHDRALARTEKIRESMARVFALATEQGVAPGRAALALARARVEAEGRGRWRPGDPTAWSNGDPLTSLRPPR
ncbi:MAG: Glu/Leu/Phe/Val dehydrogenase dimerization domain-containing protein [Acidimicrobiia bacterium]